MVSNTQSTYSTLKAIHSESTSCGSASSSNLEEIVKFNIVQFHDFCKSGKGELPCNKPSRDSQVNGIIMAFILAVNSSCF